MDLGDVMDEVAAGLEPIVGLRVHAYPIAKITPPAAIVSYPESIDYDATMARGTDRITGLPVLVIVGKASDRTARDAIAPYAAGSGPSSVKARLEAGTYTAFDFLTVTSCEFDTVTIGNIDYLAALFRLDIVGPGTA